MKKTIVLVTLMMTMLAGNALAAIDFFMPSMLLGSEQSIGEDQYGNYSPSELFEISWDSPSQIERVQIWAYLAKHHVDSPEGLYVKAWLFGKDGDKASKIRGYERCVAKYPDFLTGLLGLSIYKEPEERIALLERILKVDPTFNDYMAIRNTYFAYRDDLKDKTRADAFLRKWENRLGSELFIFDFIRGLDHYFNLKNYKKTAEYYESALTKTGGATNFEVWKWLVNLKMDKLSQGENERIGQLNRLVEAMKNTEESSLPERKKKILLHKITKYIAEKTGQSTYYVSVLNHYFTAEVAEKVRDIMWRSAKRQKTIDFLEQAIEKYPKNQKLHELVARMYSFQTNFSKAENHLKKAIQYSHINEDRWNNTKYYCDDILYPQFRAEEAYTLLKPFDGKLKNQANFFIVTAKNRLIASDYNQAQKDIDNAIALVTEAGDTPTDYILNLKKQIDTFTQRDQLLKDYNRENPFAAKWLSKNGESIKISVNFATGSDRISRSDYAKLAKIAKSVSGQGAEDYGFTIEGHTDSTGSDKINNPLSQKRAQAVVRYLSKQHSIPLLRLEAKGFGSQNPVAGNASEANRAKNRRVEVLLSANLKKPTITATTKIGGNWPTVSPDHKYFLENSYGGDYTLWDTEKFIALKTFKNFLSYGGHLTKKFRTQPEFSPNGRYIAYTNAFEAFGGELVIYDSKTGRLVAQQGFFKTVLKFAWSPFSDEIAIRYDGGLVRYDVLNKRIVAKGVIKNHVADGGFVWTADGKHLAISEKYEDGKVRIFDAQSLNQLRTLREANWPHALGASADGRYIISTNEGQKLNIWDTRNNWAHKSMTIPVKPSQIVVHPSRYEVLLNDWGGGSANKLAVVNLDSMSVVGKMTVGGSDYKYRYLDAGRKILFVNDDDHELKVLHGKTLQVEQTYRGETASSRGGLADSASGRLLSWDQEGLHVWEVNTGKKVHTWPGDYQTAKPDPNKPGDLIALLKDGKKQRTRVYRFDLATLNRTELLSLDLAVDRWGIQNGDILFAGTPFMPAETGAPNGFVRLYDLGSGKLKGEVKVEMATEPLRYSRMGYSRIKDLEISPDNSTVALYTAWGDGWRQDKKVSKATRIYSLKTGKQIRRIGTVGGLLFKDNNRLIIGTNSWTAQGDKIYDIRTGEPVGKLEGEKPPFTIGRHTALTREVEFKQKNLKIRIKNDNRIEFRDLKNEELALTIISKRNNEWIAYAPTGEFTASMNGTEKVFWLMGDKRLPFEALKEKYDNPNLIRQMLAKVISGQTPVVNVEPDIDPDVFKTPYKVSIVSANNLETKGESYLLKLAVTKEESDLPDPQFEYSLNGRPIKKGRGFEVVPVKKGPAVVEVERKFNLQDGLNVIQVSLLYKGAKVQSQTVLVTRVVANHVTSNTQLWFFGVGVSKYEKPEQNLEYAHKDAEELATLLKKQEGKLFQKVNTLTLTNEEATEKNVRIRMQRFLKKASSQDVIIIFLAGHGVQDNEQNLYFMTHDSILKEAYTGMELSKFESYLKSRPINQKVVLLMDICHAGSMGLKGQRRGAITAEEAVKQLAEGTGTVVFASSTGKESSLEDASYGGGHGAFTAALLEGLKGKADSMAGDKNGYIGIMELMNYVSRRVPEITDGDQHPTTPQSMNVRDFPLGAY